MFLCKWQRREGARVRTGYDGYGKINFKLSDKRGSGITK